MLNIKTPYVRTRVGARILMLFLCCALLPLLVMTLLSFQNVTSLLTYYSRQRLFNESKAVGMSFFERLTFFQSNLKRYAQLIERIGECGPTRIDPDLSAFFQHYAAGLMLAGSGQSRCLIPPAFAVPFDVLSQEQADHLRAGEALLVQRDDAAGAPHLYQIIEVFSPSQGRQFLCSEINLPVLVRELTEELSADGMALLVLNSDAAVLFASNFPGRSMPRDLTQKLEQTFSGTLQWHEGSAIHIAGVWTLFLKYRFLANNLRIVVSIDRDQILYPVKQFRQTFLYTVFLAFCLVLLLSLIQIRKSLVPLFQLTEGTRHIARQDFTTRIAVSSNDEFGELAASFNIMAETLNRQFETITTMVSIDRSILSSLDTRSIIAQFLTGSYRLLGCSTTALLMRSADDPSAVVLYTADGRSHDHLQSHSRILTMDESSLFASCSQHIVYDAPHAMPPLLRSCIGDSDVCLAIPLRIQETPRGMLCFGFHQTCRPSDDDIVHACQLADQIAVALSNAHLLEQLEQFNQGTLLALARAVDAKSSWTAGHSERVTQIALTIADVMGLSLSEREVLQRGGLLHDIGKIGIPADIIDKPGPLTLEEFNIIREHPRLGVRILEPIKAYREIISLVLHHHERYDGTGYPNGIAGDAISLPARIVAVADVFESIITDRPYRPAVTLDEACRILAEESGRHFDPHVVRTFLRIIEDIRRSAAAAGSDDERAVVFAHLTESLHTMPASPERSCV